MELKRLISRARRGFREDARLYFVAITGLTVAFFCLTASLLGVTNLERVADHWGRNGRMTVFVHNTAKLADVEQLATALEALPEVREVEHVSATEAREQFLNRGDVSASFADLPPDVFPASLEIRLVGGTDLGRAEIIAERIERFSAVEEVETYQGWFQQIEGL